MLKNSHTASTNKTKLVHQILRCHKCLYPRQVHQMFMCLLQCCVASIVLALKLFTTFTKVTNNVRLTGLISVGRWAETGSAPFNGVTKCSQVGRRGAKKQGLDWSVPLKRCIFFLLLESATEVVHLFSFSFIKISHWSCASFFYFI